MGPVEIAVIEFPGTRFDGDILTALADLVGRQVVSIIDLVLVSRSDDGDVTTVELSDIEADLADRFAQVDGEVMGLLSDGDIAKAATTLDAGSTAVLLVWENKWARTLAGRIRDRGGRLVVHERLDPEAVARSVDETRENPDAD